MLQPDERDNSRGEMERRERESVREREGLLWKDDRMATDEGKKCRKCEGNE